MITARELGNRYELLPALLDAVAEQHPGAYVVRNDVGNLAVCSRAGDYLGWIDVLTGEVHVPPPTAGASPDRNAPA